jgi:hypothetical protein
MERDCLECTFSNRVGSDTYECRRRAPEPNRVGETRTAMWPYVTVGDWCGEYVPREDVEG